MFVNLDREKVAISKLSDGVHKHFESFIYVLLAEESVHCLQRYAFIMSICSTYEDCYTWGKVGIEKIWELNGKIRMSSKNRIYLTY